LEHHRSGFCFRFGKRIIRTGGTAPPGAPAGLKPLDHQQPGARLDGPVTRAWGEREFELEDADGHRLIFTQG
jgi:hypothetical protein